MRTADGAARPLPVAHVLAGAAIITFAVFIVYYPCLHGAFIVDDHVLLTNNPLIKAQAT